MPNKLRHSTARVSFFAFQDMITTVTGVVMVVLMGLSLQKSESSSGQTHRQLEEARAHLRANTETLRQRQAEMAALTNRVFVIPVADRSGKLPVLIVLSATNGCCTRPGQTNVTEFKVNAGRSDFPGLLRKWNAARERLVFYVRPSGIAHFEVCRTAATRQGFSIGYDAAEEERQYVLLSSPAAPAGPKGALAPHESKAGGAR
jgi:hypothetical protein